MSKVINFGYTDTAITPDPGALTLGRPAINTAADFREKDSKTGELVVTNLTCPTDRPEQIRFAHNAIKNIYTNTGIDASVYAPSKMGVSVLAQITEVASVTDSVDAEYRVDLPLSAHLVVKVPNSEFITSDHVEALVARLVSSLFHDGSSDSTRITELLRGALKI